MVKMYCKLIIAGRMTLDKVPDKFKEAVKAALLEQGYDIQ